MLPKEGLTAHRYYRTLQPLIKTQENGAVKLTLTLLHLWLVQSFPHLVKRKRVPCKALAEKPAVIKFAAWLTSMDTLTGAFWLSSAYANWVGKEVREREAMYFTPPLLSSRLIDDVVAYGANLTKHVWLDPASGGAAFLAPVAQRMAAVLHAQGKKPRAILNHIAKHVLGNDLDPCLAAMSKQFLRMVLYREIVEAGFEPEFTVTTKDALSGLTHLRGKVDVVICNPPYRKMKGGEVDDYRNDYKDIITGQPNLYALFFKLARNCLKKSGTAGLLTPTSYLSGQYFSSLRAFIGKNFEIHQLDIAPALGAFFSVDQETAITILGRTALQAASARQAKVFHYTKGNGFVELGSCNLPVAGEAWPVPRDQGDLALINRLSLSPYRLCDYGYVARIGHFVWNRDKRKTYRKFPKRKSSSVFPLIWSSNVLNGSGFMHGRRQPVHENRNYVDMGSPTACGIVRSPCVVLQRVTSSDQQRRLVGAPLPQELLDSHGGVVGENHVVFLVQSGSEVKLTTAMLAEVLRSKAIDRLFRCISGAVNVSVYELSHLPMPDPEKLSQALKSCASIDEAVDAAFAATPLNGGSHGKA